MPEITFTDANFPSEVEQEKSGPVLVDFWATWCGPCQAQGPIVEVVAEELAGRAKVGKLDVDKNPVSAQKYGIMSLPTIMLFKNGQVVWQASGTQAKETIVEEITKALS